MIKEYSVVKTLVEKENFPIGSKGVVVSIYHGDNACEVELWDNEDYPVDVVTYMLNELAEFDS